MQSIRKAVFKALGTHLTKLTDEAVGSLLPWCPSLHTPKVPKNIFGSKFVKVEYVYIFLNVHERGVCAHKPGIASRHGITTGHNRDANPPNIYKGGLQVLNHFSLVGF